MRCCAAAAARHGGQVPGRGAKHWSYIVVIIDISHWARDAVPRSVPRRSERMMTVTSVSYGPTPCSARYSASFSARGPSLSARQTSTNARPLGFKTASSRSRRAVRRLMTDHPGRPPRDDHDRVARLEATLGAEGRDPRIEVRPVVVIILIAVVEHGERLGGVRAAERLLRSAGIIPYPTTDLSILAPFLADLSLFTRPCAFPPAACRAPVAGRGSPRSDRPSSGCRSRTGSRRPRTSRAGGRGRLCPPHRRHFLAARRTARAWRTSSPSGSRTRRRS